MDVQQIHDGIIDNPDFNLNVTAKRYLRALCTENERLRAESLEDSATIENLKELKRQAEAENERLRASNERYLQAREDLRKEGMERAAEIADFHAAHESPPEAVDACKSVAQAIRGEIEK